jgi:cell division protein ZapA (FtsZ GTPase activity inhibitor)
VLYSNNQELRALIQYLAILLLLVVVVAQPQVQEEMVVLVVVVLLMLDLVELQQQIKDLTEGQVLLQTAEVEVVEVVVLPQLVPLEQLLETVETESLLL